MNIALWILQVLVALFFGMAGIRHSFTPREQLSRQYPWVAATPSWLMRFIGIAEVCGAVGLILPMALAIAARLTVAAAIGLAVVMGGACILHMTRKEMPQGAVTFVLMLLAIFLAIGRMTLAPA